jgi:hypothetical protein
VAQDKQSLAAMEREYRRGPPWLMMLFVAMIALLAMFFILNAQMADVRTLHSAAEDMNQQSTLEQDARAEISSFR